MSNTNSLDSIRHSLSHLMSMAVQELYPQVGLGVGPAIENGFYQDYDLPEAITPELLPKLEKRIKEMIKDNIKFEQHEVGFNDAYKFYQHDPYKTEFIDDLKAAGEKKVSFYKSGGFDNLCAGPHVNSTKEINPEAFKLTKIAGAYWRGDEKNKMLTRIYGVAFTTKEELVEYLAQLAEAEKRDHRKLGKEQGLFVFSELVGSGLPLYTFAGALVRRLIIDYSNELQQSIGYREVHTPNMNRAELFKVSGHYEKYKEDMFRVTSSYTDEEYFLKPMNCPQHTQIYASQLRSYKDLPIRIADFANLYRDEKPGELSGLARLRCFCQDDGHSFCREDQIKDEFLSVLGIINQAMATYDMKYYVRLSLWDPAHPEKYLGEPATWEKSQQLLESILKDQKIEYKVSIGEAAIYGPKMDLVSCDSLGREWQISTIQLDFIMPQRFGLTYIDSDGKEKTPVMIHRAIVGSPERFMAILIEHYAGVWPVWLAPVQALVLPVGVGHIEHCQTLVKALSEAGIRAEIDDAGETLGKRIRGAEMRKISYVIVAGDKEIESKALAVRIRGQKDMLELSQADFIKRVQHEINTRRDQH